MTYCDVIKGQISIWDILEEEHHQITIWELLKEAEGSESGDTELNQAA
ncbi:MAG: hypothetical protein K6E12_02665 [Saccharofermentans sp.]|nr:hypothetical protein [Saccharofermentans sp.]